MMIANKCIAQPWECDVMGHLTTRFYVAMFDDASYHFLYEAFGWTISAHDSRRFGWADVRHVIEYKAEVTAGDVLEIRVHLKKVGTSSITVLYEMINLARDEVAATLEAICVYFDLEERRATPLTEEMRQRSLPFLDD